MVDGGAVIGLGSDLCHNEHIPVKNKDIKTDLRMICIVQCSRKIAVFLSFMPITDLKSGGKDGTNEFCSTSFKCSVLLCSCWSQTLFSCDIPDINCNLSAPMSQNYLFLP